MCTLTIKLGRRSGESETTGGVQSDDESCKIVELCKTVELVSRRRRPEVVDRFASRTGV